MGDEDVMTYGSTVKEQAVVDLISEWGGIDGGHHKQWLLDQIMRKVLEDMYPKWVAEWEYGQDGPGTYEWDKGIAP